jgi:tRNA nucleotidyltransferase (CCA-adding enzyme)
MKRNIKSLIKKRLPREIQDVLARAGKVADKSGYELFAVGGFVRDLLLNIENLDVDLVIEGEGLKFAQRLSKLLGGRIKIHREFQTAALTFSSNLKIDIATARTEIYSRPAALPRVEAASLKEDLYRRDFTINTLAVKFNRRGFGELVDFFGGEDDLKRRLIKILHKGSFIDDPTRMFRALRFAGRFNFEIERKTSLLMREALNSGILHRLSGTRLRNEIILILKEEEPLRVVKKLKSFRIIEHIHPRLKLKREVFPAFKRIQDLLPRFKKEKIEGWTIYLLALLENLKGKDREILVERFKLSRKVSKVLREGRRAKEIMKKLGRKENLMPSTIYKYLYPLPLEISLFILARTGNIRVKKRILAFLGVLRKTKIKITGEDLKSLGYKPSPRFKKILEEVLRAKLEGRVSTKREELRYVVDNF